MRWLADECIAARVVKRLREAGHDVSYAAEMAAGEPDIAIVALAIRENRLLLTDDKDFGELVVRRRWAVPGVVLMRVTSDEPLARWSRLHAAITRFGDGLHGQYLVVEDARFRIRPIRGGD